MTTKLNPEKINHSNTLQSSVYFVSLGCPKNLVDSQVMLGLLKSNKFQITEEAETADTIIINTCSFIDSAKKESIDTIFEMSRFREEGALKNLVVSGCMVQRYAKELEVEMPEVDLFIGTGEYHRVVELLQKKALGKLKTKTFVDIPTFIHTAETPRINTGLNHSAFLKISEGCVRNCSFCIIPELRGHKVRSRSVDSLVSEAKKLVSDGVKELNLVAQDLTHYGIDNNYNETLADLLRALVQIKDLHWIRLHYAYPDNFTDEVIDIIAKEEKIVKYLDMPIQYGDDKVLKLMNRRITTQQIRERIESLRKKCPEMVFRTNIIVGHPGETEESYQNTKQFLADLELDHVGVFKYSLEEGTPSFRLAEKIGSVPEEQSQKRYNELMELQQSISWKKNKAMVGKTIYVLVEGLSRESDLLLQGRWAGQAQEIDGVILINDGDAKVGEMVKVEITEALPYDLLGRIVP
ncbi:MAG: 30S ribosomal protein S12 methylthiotransferase RimO [Oligoflexia bacterium]|nr:30S ribosomal protein S12 methylthiotransferase RimO [Oligoflexia bacterium]